MSLIETLGYAISSTCIHMDGLELDARLNRATSGQEVLHLNVTGSNMTVFMDPEQVKQLHAALGNYLLGSDLAYAAWVADEYVRTNLRTPLQAGPVDSGEVLCDQDGILIVRE